MTEPGKRRMVSAVYGAGILQGAAFVLVPSLGKILSTAPYGYGAKSYGLLYFPEIGGAILGALLAGPLQRRAGSPAVLRAGLSANAIGMALLALASLTGGSAAYAAILAQTLCLGVGFGLTLATLNPYAALLFPGAPTTAITVLNGLIGAATALAPLALHAAAAAGHWGAIPFALMLGFALLCLVALPSHRADDGGRLQAGMLPFAIAVLLYAAAEGGFSSWAQIYVGRVARPGAFAATLALSAFWAGITAMRLVLGLVPERGRARGLLFLLSASGIGASFAALACSRDPLALVATYAAAGAACSIYYPYVMAYGLRAWPRQAVGFAGLLVAALMIGEGIGSLAPGALASPALLPRMYLALSLIALPLGYFAWTLPRRGPSSGAQKR